MRKQKASPKDQREKACPLNHGVKVGKFCNECGTELVWNDSHIPEKHIVLEVCGNDSCPCCKDDLLHGHQKFCPGCGHKLSWQCL